MRLRKGFEILDDRRGPGGRIGRGIGVAALVAASSGSLPMMTGLNAVNQTGQIALGAVATCEDSASGTMPASKISLNAVAFTGIQEFYTAADLPSFQEGGAGVRISPTTYAIVNWPNDVIIKATYSYLDAGGTRVYLPMTYTGQASKAIAAGASWSSDNVATVDHLGAAYTVPKGTLVQRRYAVYFAADLGTTGQMVTLYHYGSNVEGFLNISKYSTAGVTAGDISGFLAGGAAIGTSFTSGLWCPHWITGSYTDPIISICVEGDSIACQGYVRELGLLANEAGVNVAVSNWSRHTRQLTHVHGEGAGSYDVDGILNHHNVALLAFGANDVANGRTKAQFQTQLTDVAGYIEAANPRVLKVAVPPTPFVSSSDSYHTLANQTVSGNAVNNRDIVQWLRSESGATPLADANLDAVCDLWWAETAWGTNATVWSVGQVTAGSATGKWRVDEAYYADPTNCVSFGDFTTDAAAVGPFNNSFFDADICSTRANARMLAINKVMFTSGANSGLVGSVNFAYKYNGGTPTYSNGQVSLAAMANNIEVGVTGKLAHSHNTDTVHPSRSEHQMAARNALAFASALTAF
jgi:lysophospholipase L1-like esterase